MTEPRPDYVQLAQLRLGWARQRIDEFAGWVEAFLEGNPYTVPPKSCFEREGVRIVYRIRVHQQPPSTLRFAAGSIVHDLRAVLDNLVWGAGQIFEAKDRLALRFYRTEEPFLREYAPQIKRLPPAIQEWIRSVQPCHGGDTPQLLFTLHELDRLDKHRAPDLMAAAIPSATFLPFIFSRLDELGMGFEINTVEFGALEDGAEVLNAVIPYAATPDFKPEFPIGVAFDKRGPATGRDVIEFLREAHEHIHKKVLPVFKPFRT